MFFSGFYSPEEFCWFNMLNFHFFHGEGARAVYQAFLRSATSLAVLLDPPFGARIELISHTLRRIRSEFGGNKPEPRIFWIFPYYMEKKINVRYLH